ncbi:MAG: diacylglycerol kinase family protein [Bacteroidales bacterium]|nr:diacylglycerol kinase family protein [Bacteroidales bacterium]
MKRKILFILNPHSGIGRHRRVEGSIRRYLDKSLFDYEVVHTQHPGHATTLAAAAAAAKTDIVAVAGGDGSVNEVVNGIYGTDTILALIPTGSGNGLARYLKIPLRATKAIQLINELSVTKIDLGFVNERLFVSIAGVGFDAHIADMYSRANYRGFMTYFSMIASSFQAYKPKKYTLQFEGKTIKEKALLISFSNSNQFGYNTSFAPEASITDGMLDISIIKKPPLLKTPLMGHLLYFKRINESSYVDIYRARKAVVKKKKKIMVNIDGEAVKMNTKKLSLSTEKKALRIIVPK